MKTETETETDMKSVREEIAAGNLKPATDYKPIRLLNESLIPPIVVVCMSCLPSGTFFEKYPALRGHVDISHGICQRHKIEWMKALGL